MTKEPEDWTETEATVKRAAREVRGAERRERETWSTVKRFLVFGGYYYYPVGGADDLLTMVDTLGEATAYAGTQRGADWIHAFDLKDRKTHILRGPTAMVGNAKLWKPTP